MGKKGIIWAFFCLLLGLPLASLGCVDPEDADGGGTGGTSLYVFDSSDGATNRVLVYSDVAALFEDSSVQPSRRMRGSKIDRVKNLAWGGMCFDPDGNRLYLVSEAGDVVRIEYARTQNGDVSNMNEIFSFRLGTSDSERLSNGKFGQASLDSRDRVLYVTESNSSEARVWVIRNPQTAMDGSSVSASEQLFTSGDKGGTGVVAYNGVVYAYFDDGSNIPDYGSGRSYAGPRLRKGNSSAFSGNPIIGDAGDSVNKTLLAKYGCLATDLDGNVYMARHMSDAGASGNAILYFKPGTFNPGLNQAPDDKFGAMSRLRIISHAVKKDWLAGAESDGDNGGGTLLLWKSPSSSARTSKSVPLGSSVSIRGLALDGSN